MTERLLSLASQVDIIDLVGKIISNPRRNAVAASTAEVVALAHATERFWEVAIEAETLVRALKREQSGDDQQENEREHAIQTQVDRITDLMIALRDQNNTHPE
ncbi:conserved protein of unknown function [Nitratireductor aquimarinus]|uniref:hypothetical protein n=1 Tax=Nitratireductor aquimarinus TaxID=889300 RepID=UPI003B5A3F91